jgi:hypothetical protein
VKDFETAAKPNNPTQKPASYTIPPFCSYFRM